VLEIQVCQGRATAWRVKVSEALCPMARLWTSAVRSCAMWLDILTRTAPFPHLYNSGSLPRPSCTYTGLVCPAMYSSLSFPLCRVLRLAPHPPTRLSTLGYEPHRHLGHTGHILAISSLSTPSGACQVLITPLEIALHRAYAPRPLVIRPSDLSALVPSLLLVLPPTPATLAITTPTRKRSRRAFHAHLVLAPAHA
jgi:hypothetical protein